MIGTCPDAGVLHRFLNGPISDSHAGLVAEHLSQCYTCRSSAITLSSFDLVEQAIQNHSGSNGPSSRSAADVLEAAQTGLGSSASAGSSDLHFLSPAQEPDELGRLGPYRVLKVLGEGGMGIVLQGEDVQLGRSLALKVMRPTVACTEAARKRFVLEARATAAIEHDNIVTIYQVGEDRGVPYLAMQLLQGESLDQRLRSHGPLPVADVLWIGRQVALGLAAAHDQGLVHRDVKPSNIWLESGRQRIKILDFGLARQAGGDGEVTKVGMIVGTPAYMAPELAGSGVIDFRCDLFSLGCVLYRMATGELPFKGVNSLAILRSLAVETPRPLHEINPAIPRALSDLVSSLLSKEPSQRPVSAQAVADALAAIGRDPAPLQLSGSRFFGSLESIELAPLESEIRPAAPAPTRRTGPARAARAARSSAGRVQAPAPSRSSTPGRRVSPSQPSGSTVVRKPRPASPISAQAVASNGSRVAQPGQSENVASLTAELWDEVAPALPSRSTAMRRYRKGQSWVQLALVAGGLSFVAAASVAVLTWVL